MKRAELLKALEIVKPGLATKETIEQTTSFAFVDDYVVTYNDEVSVRHPVAGLGITGAIKADELYKLLGKLKGDDIEVSVNGSEVVLSSGRAKAGFTLQSEIKLPLEEVAEKSDWIPLPENFMKGIEFTMSTCSRDMRRPALTCINVQSNGVLQSSDNFRASTYDVGAALVGTYLLPASSAQVISKYKITQMSEGKGWVNFRTGENGTEFSCRIFEEAFPSIEAVLNVQGSKIELPATIDEALDRAAVFCTQEQILDQKVVVTISDKRLRLRAEGETGWFEEEVNMAYRGKGIDFIINPNLLRMILSQTRTCIAGERCLKFSGDNWQHVVALIAK